MDDFGVLVKGYGIKPQGKSSPMASSKATRSFHKSVNLDPPSFGTNSTYNSNSGSGSFYYDSNDDLFGFKTSNKSQSFASSEVIDDVFGMRSMNNAFSGGGGVGGGDIDIESMFKGSMNLNSNPSDVSGDIWGVSGRSSSNAAVGTDDLLSSDPVDDFFGKLGSDRSGSKVVNTDELLPGFGIGISEHDRAPQAGSRENSSGSYLEEFEDFVAGGTKKTAKGHLGGFPATKEAKKTGSSLDELEDFVTGGTKKTDKGHLSGFSTKKEAKKSVSQKSQEANFIDIEGSSVGDNVHNNKVKNASDLLFPDEATDLEIFFGAHAKKSVPLTEDTSFGTHTIYTKKSVPGTVDKPMNKQSGGLDLCSETPFRMEKNVPVTGFPDDFSSIFGGASAFEGFEEIEGESEARRRARFERYQIALARRAQAVAELNEREYKAQKEQEEKHRIADAMDFEMKQWAAGKEGNLRALLSCLQQVLAPELGWKPVTLTDLITSSQVKIAYKKAALCVHPDKVQQKGASIQQKFVAEKVFDLLKEAWNKFNAEELR